MNPNITIGMKLFILIVLIIFMFVLSTDRGYLFLGSGFSVLFNKQFGVSFGSWPSENVIYKYLVLGYIEFRFYPSWNRYAYLNLELERPVVKNICPKCKKEKKEWSQWAVGSNGKMVFICSDCEGVFGLCSNCGTEIKNDEIAYMRNRTKSSFVLICADCNQKENEIQNDD